MAFRAELAMPPSAFRALRCPKRATRPLPLLRAEVEAENGASDADDRREDSSNEFVRIYDAFAPDKDHERNSEDGQQPDDNVGEPRPHVLALQVDRFPYLDSRRKDVHDPFFPRRKSRCAALLGGVGSGGRLTPSRDASTTS